MAGKNTITINGKSYDAITGKPVAASQHIAHKPAGSQPQRAFSDISGPPRLHVAVVPEQPIHPHIEVKALAVHQKLQKSQTLHRAALKKPAPLRQLIPAPFTVEADYARPTEQQRSPAITRFAPSHHATSQANTVNTPVVAAPVQAPRVHPVVAKALANQPAPAPQSSKELKEALIRERLAEAEPNVEHHAKHQRRITGQPRMATIMISSLALLLLAGYLTYINLPNISMRVAATRAGIAANYPNYNPDGYHFVGPITYQPGEINITFRSNTNNRNFNITQKASSWDSQAVLDNYVNKKTGTYLTYQERGLTVYSFGNHAAWVNGGLLYTIDGDAPLSSDQLLHIATSM
jgi:hypothetical protein